MATETFSPTDTGNGHVPRGSNGHGDSNEPRGGPRGNPFQPDPSRPDDEFTQIRLPRGLVRAFNDWYEGQAPDARQRKSKDHYYQIAFRLGLEQLVEALPPVQSLDDRIAAKFGNGKK